MYWLGVKELQGLLDEVEDGTNLLLLGPPLSGKEEMVNEILYHGISSGEGGIIVTTNSPAEEVLKWFERRDPDHDREILLAIDCIPQPRAESGERVRKISDPTNLTGINVAISEFVDRLRSRGVERMRICINSISTLLVYSDLKTVFRFLHTLTGRVRAMNALGVYVLEDGMHDEHVASTIKQLMDEMVHIRMNDDRRMIRVAGVNGLNTRWTECADRAESKV